jgi:hypothetical protein
MVGTHKALYKVNWVAWIAFRSFNVQMDLVRLCDKANDSAGRNWKGQRADEGMNSSSPPDSRRPSGLAFVGCCAKHGIQNRREGP